MSQYFEIHSDNPQPRLIRRAVEILHDDGLIAYPTDSSYAFGWCIDNKQAMDRVQRIRRTDNNHVFTLVCSDLSAIATYARVDNGQYRALKSATPGPFTFILRATRELPRRLQNPKRKTVGIRVPDHAIVRELLTELGEPLMSSTLLLPGDELPQSDPQLIRQQLGDSLDLIIDGGSGGHQPTTVVDLASDHPAVLRHGKGDATLLF